MLVASAAACGGGSQPTTKIEPSTAAATAGSGSAQPIAPVQSVAIPTPAEPTPPTAVQEPAPVAEGRDFIDDARLLYRVAACGAT
ncbi:MAG: hypothetical protein AB7L28_25155, partial [Kofleriaceae bacterium]